MFYEDTEVIKAFKIYSNLAVKGKIQKDEYRLYIANDSIRGLVDEFAKEVDSTVVVVGDYIYMIPIAKSSIYHISNENIRKKHLPSRSTNSDIYLMYLAIIVLFGEFYDGYQSINPTRDFVSLDYWLSSLSERIFSLKDHSEEDLKKLEKEYEYNWIVIIEKWDALNDLRENVKKQDARTESRLSFLNVTKEFLKKSELIDDIGNDEIELTEKAKIIIQRYYMSYEFNRGILEFMYNLEQKQEGI